MRFEVRFGFIVGRLELEVCKRSGVCPRSEGEVAAALCAAALEQRADCKQLSAKDTVALEASRCNAVGSANSFDRRVGEERSASRPSAAHALIGLNVHVSDTVGAASGSCAIRVRRKLLNAQNAAEIGNSRQKLCLLPAFCV